MRASLANFSTANEPDVKAGSDWPKITLVTPVFNSVRYIEDTIRSVVFQGYPSLEYIIVDGGSTDGTVEIIRKYSRHISFWITEKDNGRYDALNKGFAAGTGDVMGWISASDMLHVRSLFVIGSVFRTLPEVEWITGLPTGFNEEGMPLGVSRLPRWSRMRFLVGANRYIQQESTFWRRSLWERAGGCVDATRKNASDFELWVRFFRHAKLYPVDALIGGYRTHADSGTSLLLDECHRIHEEVINAETYRCRFGILLRMARYLSAKAERMPLIRKFWRRSVILPLYFRQGPDSPPFIVSRDGTWVMQR
jgi:glycosyltransferase involved in cell wall biosynthesis